MNNIDQSDLMYDIAIVGMSGRFPGARSVDEFWRNVRDGVESITFFTEEELAEAGAPLALLKHPNYVRANGVLEDIDVFDAAFFGFSPREAEVMDPQQRLFLECAWEALEIAGYDPETYRKSIGVYAGTTRSSYVNNIYSNPELAESVGTIQIGISNDKDHLAPRISYKLNLKGASVTVQTACSTSLVAVSLACQNLLNFQCDMALAGGVSISAVQKAGYLYMEGGINSPDGHCRAFDAQAQGCIGGNGVGVVLLKRLTDALADGDSILAVIKGSATNNDGSLKVGYTAPSVEGQAAVITEAMAMAGISPETISYVEAHGTGTTLGDPIEIAALTKAYRTQTAKKNFCAVGSAKTNIGHLDAAAGVAGLIKAVLALKHKQLPPSINFTEPNPKIDFAGSPFFVNTRLTNWERNGTPRRAAVSSFGIGGTNAHVVLEEAPSVELDQAQRPFQLLPLSARSETALEDATQNLLEHLKNHPEQSLADVAYTLQAGRRAFTHRRAFVCRDHEDAVRVLETFDPQRTLIEGAEPVPERPVVFMFPGQGTQYVGMGEELYRHEPLFRQTVDQCCEVLRAHLNLDLREVLYPTAENRSAAEAQLRETALTQPALFVIEYALAQLWMSWGVRPRAMIGHSIGEYVAACVAGVISLEDALSLVAKRGAMMQGLDSGAMLAVPLCEEDVTPMLGAGLSLAAVNNPKLLVLSGEFDAIAKLQSRLSEKEIECQLLHTSHAFHSRMMQPIVESFAAEVAKITLHAPSIPFVSNVTGTWIKANEAISPAYWAKQLRQAVRFSDGLEELMKEQQSVLLEVGPGQALQKLAKMHPSKTEQHVVDSSLRRAVDNESDIAVILKAVGRLWQAGMQLDWAVLHQGQRRRRVALPTYPFERQRYWAERRKMPVHQPAALQKRSDIADWFYAPSWKQTPAYRSNTKGAPETWLVFVDESEIGPSLAQRLAQEGHEVISVRAGQKFGRDEAGVYTVNPASAEDYVSLIAGLQRDGIALSAIAHFWSATTVGAFEAVQAHGFYSVLFLTQALEKQGLTDPLRIVVVTSGVQSVTGEEQLCPEKATLLGLRNVIPQEYPNISCVNVDIVVPPAGTQRETQLVEQLAIELTTKFSDEVVAYRGSRRWVQSFEPVRLRTGESGLEGLRDRGTYLITGGLGSVGLVLAEHLARTVRARLVLVGRKSLSEISESKLAAVRRLEQLGSEVLIVSADVADEAQMRAALRQTLERFGELHGVIHGAGISGPQSYRSISETGATEAGWHFQPKVYGLYVLQRVLEGQPLDFCLLLSSLSSVLGGLGFAAYSSANVFMDAFAHAQREREGTPWISVNWDGWQLGDEPETARKIGAGAADLSINAAEGADVFSRVLAVSPITQIIVSTGDLQPRLDKWIKRKTLAASNAPTAKASSVTRYARPQLKNEFVAARTELEQTIAEIWQDLLGIDQVGINDNFFELGGHSLLATQLISRLRKTIQVEIPLRLIFETHTLAALAEGIAPLLDKDEALAIPSIEPVSREGELPLSFAQQRLWFLHQFEPDSNKYNMPLPLHLEGAIDHSVLERTLNELVRRHEVLRTTFVAVDGQPLQVIAPAKSSPLPLVDLSELPEHVRRAEANRLAIEEAQRPFNLSQGPLLRTTLVRLAPEEYFVLLNMHHIVSDGWSMGIFTKEIAQLYAAFARGENSPLAELPVQYADFAAWQRNWLTSDVLERHLDYWRKQLAGAPRLLELPTDRPRPPIQTHRGASHSLILSEELSERLNALSREHGATLFMTLLGAFQTLLMRYTGQEDISIGTSVAGRDRLETEPLIGFFINNVVIRTDLGGDPTFSELLGRMREVVLGAQQHQNLPFEKLVDDLQVERSLDHTPLFQVFFVLQNAAQESAELPGVKLKNVSTGNKAVQFDLSLDVIESARNIRFALQYNTDLFDEATIKRMLSHFNNLFEAICADPNTRLQELSLLSEEESRHLLFDFNPPAPALPPAVCMHQLFEAHAAVSPESPAISFDGFHLSYGKVNERANRLAHHLRSLGVGPEDRVAVMLDRTPDLVIAILGILKAGAAYLPLDPAYPQERLAFMLEDAGAQVVVTEQALVERWLLDSQATLVCLDDQVIATAASTNPSTSVRAENAAYVIYTSGSTGQPKGVVVTHENVWRLLEVTRADFAFDSSDVWTLFHSVSFDFSVWELWGPLTHGGRLVVVPYWVSREPEAFYQLLQEEAVTVLNQTPSAFRQLMKVDETVGSELALRSVIFGGEALEMSTLRGWFERHGDERPRLVNMYGITETTVHVTYRELSARDTEGGSVIGGALGDLELYVLDQQMRAVPEGVSGELYVGGAGVARGYLGRAELTAQRFVPHPYSERAGARLYRTGDLARRRADGELEYVGRIDEQVKIRGFRIELGEIANALREQAAVRECVVLALGENSEEKRIVAYVVADEGVNTGELREELKQRLPEYMIPSAIVLLGEMPLTRNGKVDRRALPAPEDVTAEVATMFVAPRTPIEEVLAGIWSDVLRTTRISVNDNFFELGGHSLLATQVVSRIREAFSVEIPVRSIFEKQTVAMLATEVEQLMYQGGSLYAPPIVPVPRDVELPLSFAQQRLWFIDRLTPGSPLYNMPIPLHLEGAIEHSVLERTLNELVRRHEVLRTSFISVDGQPLQVIAPAKSSPLPLVDLSELPENVRRAEARRLAIEEAQRPFNLSQGPLLRATLVRLAPEEYFFLLTMHHIVSDGWSMGIFRKEIAQLYEAFARGENSPLAELPVQYADFAVWQRNWLTGDVLERHLDYWRKQLAGAPRLLELPTDRPRPPIQTHRGESHSLILSEELSERLNTLSREHGATLFMTLLAAFQTLLMRYTGQEDISTGTSVAGRDRLETEPLIGFFINTLVIRTDLGGDPTFSELLGRMREVVLGAQQHQNLPFEKLVDDLQVERSLNHTPLFQVFFVLQNAAQETAELPDVKLNGVDAGMKTVKFDLILDVIESARNIRFVLEYNCDLFDSATIRRMLSHFNNLFEAICADPGTRLQELSLLSEEESRHLLFDFNPPAPALPPAACIHQLFEAQAALRPDAPALSYDGLHLSYEKINARANRLAHHLRSLGVGPEQRVAMLLDRTPDLVITILGILKAGAAYLPLDPSYPEERLAFMLSDAGAQVIVTEQALVEPWLSQQTGLTVVQLDDAAVTAAPSSNLMVAEVGVKAENAAYVIYTSGSTGQPKGVVVTHENVWRLLEVTRADFGFDERDVWTLFHSVCFDFSVWELWGPLTQGGRLVVVPYWVSREPEAFYQLLQEEAVTVLNQTPSAFRQLMKVDEVMGGELPLRVVVFGGEALEMSTLRGWFERHGEERPRLVNMYGITETTVHVTYRELSARDTEGGSVIGGALGDLELYVLDPQMRAVPEGVSGELYVGGAGVARGYLGRAELTAQRFVPHPYSERAGARLYRTGDLARRRADGELEYVGRIDEQVKIRGFRIELGEIANALREQAAVRECVVLALGANGAEKRLVAYVVADEGVNTGELREELKQRLPEYMIPSAIVLLAEMPLTRNGKVDRRALPAPEDVTAEVATMFVAPRTPVEEVLAGIWSDVLRVTRIGVNDNFFDLGGHSLLATKVVSRIREALSIEIPVRAIFEKQTLAMLATEVEQLMYQGGALYAPPIERRSRDVELPLSFAQQRLWFLHQFEPDSNRYNMPIPLHLEGAIEHSVLERTLNELVRRHEVLRTTFATVDGQPLQVIAPAKSSPLPLVDLSELSENVRRAEANRLAIEEAQRPFNLSQGPLLRATLVRLAPEEYFFLLTMHHIVSDGWSMGIFTKEIAQLYTAFARGENSPLPELPVQYADFAVWQRNWLTGDVLERHLDYWRKQLAGAPRLLELPTDRPRPPIQTHRGESHSLILSEELSERLNTLSREHGATLFMTLLAAFQTLLMRYTGQEDISTGTSIAGRDRVETEPLIGFFINNVVIRTDLSGDPTFSELLGRMREVVLGAQQHQNLPFEKLVDDLQVERSLDHTPLFQVFFVLQNTVQETLELPGVKLKRVNAGMKTVKFDLTLDVIESARNIRFVLEYNCDLFDSATIKRMLSHFNNLFEAICADPGTRLQELSLLSEEESRHLLFDFNPPAPALPPAACIHQLFEAQAARCPDAPALSYEGFHLSYEKINARANRLAHHLRSLGVGPEQRVAMLLDRTPDLVITILGILKAGAAYLPLDPSYPEERLAFMLADAGAQVIVTEQALVEPWLSQQTGLTVVQLDDPAVAAAPSSNLMAAEVGVRAENAAYVIYTSGSTGQPKGVVVTHENVWRLLEVTRADFAFDERDVWTLFHSVCFDFSVWELWGPLTHGGRLVVVPYWVSREPESFYDLLREEQVTVLNQTPSAFRQLMKVDEVMGGELPLRVVVFGGEALEMSTLRGWFERHGDERPRLVNMYGITETTVHVTYRELSARDIEGGSVIGGALGDLELYVLDPQMRAVPEGVSGELYVGGAGVARGYLGRAELTVQRFVPHPYSERAGARLYRTGDLARRRADGELEYVGRIDEQVKIRGFRIELGEIANALREQAAVRECVVLALGENSEEKRIVAYVVADEGVNTGELREELKQRLPEYMIPSAIVLLAEMPLTRNGKVDRRALPAPEDVTAEVATMFVAPRTPVEEVLAGIWSDVLRVTRISVNDNFFELGGHSLLATQVVSHIREALSIEIPVRAIFEKQTLAMLATEVEQLMYQGIAPQAPPIVPVPRDGELPLSFAQQRMWFLNQLEPESHLYNMTHARTLSGALNIEALEQTFSEIIRRHEVLRTSFRMGTNGRPVQIIEPVQPVRLVPLDLSGLPAMEQEAQVREVVDREARKPFDLSQAPLLRIVLIRLSEQEHVVIFSMHHIVGDAWSENLLQREIGLLYEAFSAGQPSPLAELPVQYADFAVWQKQWMESEVLEEQLSYWKQQLGDLPVLELPLDKPRPALQTFAGSFQEILLSESVAKAIKSLNREAGVTLFMTVLAAFQTLLHRYNGQDEIIVGTGIANRNRAETEGLLGYFVNTLALRVDLSGNPTFRELLGRVREVTLGAYAHQDMPFELLVEKLQPERTANLTPLFQVWCETQTIKGQSRSVTTDLTMNPMKYVRRVAYFDLMLFMTEAEGNISGYLEFNTDLFEPDTIGEMTRRLVALLESVSANPDMRLLDIPLEQAETEALAESIAPECVDEDSFTFEAKEASPSFTFKTKTKALPFKKSETALTPEAIRNISAIPRISRDQNLPLSFAQQRLWFLYQLEPESAVYNVPVSVRLKGTLDIHTLERSLSEVVRRHEVLRTSFTFEGYEPVQVIAQAQPLRLPLIDLTLVPVAERENKALELVAEEAKRPFDLTTGPVLRVSLIRIDSKHHVVMLTMHHIVCDGWSMGVLMREIATIYTAFINGKRSPLPELPIQYADFAHWQRSWLRDETLEAQLSYWRRQLADAPPVLELPFDRPRPAMQTFHGATESLMLSKPLSGKLRRMVKQENVTLFMLLLAAYKVLLYQYTLQEDIVVSTGIANRNRRDIEDLIGLHVNTLLLRTNFSGNPTFRELLGRVREVTLGAFDHQDLPIEMLVEALQPDNSSSASPLFQTMFMLQNASTTEESKELPGLTMSGFGDDKNTTSKFDLTLFATEVADSLKFTIEYNTDLFNSSTIVQMFKYFQTLLESIVENPDKEIDDISFMTTEESQQLIESWA